MERPVKVLKFGGSVLRDESDLVAAAHEVYRYYRRGIRVVAVVSALGSTTDDLMSRARRLCVQPRPELLAPVLATGETTSANLFGIALDGAGVPAQVLSPHQIGLRARGPVLDADPMDLDAAALLRELDRVPVAVVPGFVAQRDDGRLVLLGRGGSDLSALFIAHHVKADCCRLIKDVDGCYESDPALPGPPPRRLLSASFDDALALGGAILQPKALRFARDHHVAFDVAGLCGVRPTRIGRLPRIAVEADTMAASRPLRVGLLGLGTVAGGVYRELCCRPDLFDVRRILVRNLDTDRGVGAVSHLLCTDVREVLDTPCDVVVELAGGVQPATEWMASALRRGRHVVTANKAALAAHGCLLARTAQQHACSLLFSASVGGAVPALETARRLASEHVIGFEGVLNGTTNFVLDQIAQGTSFAEAVRRAQQAGLAEADPRLDLDGSDVAHKLTVLARHTFGDVPIRWQRREGIAGKLPDVPPGHAVRLVGSCHRQCETPMGVGQASPAELIASVEVRVLPERDALAQVAGEQNAVRFSTLDARLRRCEHIVAGRGAGRVPTTTAVMADLFELARAHKLRASGRSAKDTRFSAAACSQEAS
ncbi:MAG: homoserine dehydrogenase [Proteobacteria bacterium]|nr:homoserine dehydrogenase [Pseudomonadota bacterium]